jgi:hypothetical protein
MKSEARLGVGRARARDPGARVFQKVHPTPRRPRAVRHLPRVAAPVPHLSLTPRDRLVHVGTHLNWVGAAVGAPPEIPRTPRDREVAPEKELLVVRSDTADRQDLARERAVGASERRGGIVRRRGPRVLRWALLRRRTNRVSGLSIDTVDSVATCHMDWSAADIGSLLRAGRTISPRGVTIVVPRSSRHADPLA